MSEPGRRERRHPVAAALVAACWLCLLGGIALATVDPGRAGIGVAVIVASLVTGSSALAWMRGGRS